MGKRGNFILIINFIIILLIMTLACKSIKSSAKVEKYKLPRDISEIYTISDSYEYHDIMQISEVQVQQKEAELENQENQQIESIYNNQLTEYEKYLLAKIAMAEAENQNIKTKALVIMTILNRVESKDFPDSISEVIFQNNGKTYQFSPVMPEGRWWDIEPNGDCYNAVEIALSTECDSEGALYFESFENCEDKNNWHNRNLTYLYQSGDLRFYK